MGRSKRKPTVVRKITKEDEEDESELSQNESKHKSNGHDSLSEDIDLPEGTVVVKPEPVKDKKGDRFKGPEFKSAKKLSDEYLAIVTCTACAKQINTGKPGAARRHPILQVLICKRCCKYYKSGEFTQDSNGIDEQCRWCGEGGNLICCDHCTNAFCKACIKRNLGRSHLSEIDADEDSQWHCYVCDPKPMAGVLDQCNQIFEKIENDKKKAELLEKKKKGKEESRKSVDNSGSSTPGDPQTALREVCEQFVQSLGVNTENVGQVIDDLCSATNTLGDLLGLLKKNIHDAEEVNSRDTSDHHANRRTDQKDDLMVRIVKSRCVEMLNKGMYKYVKTVKSCKPVNKKPAANQEESPKSARISEKKMSLKKKFEEIKASNEKKSARKSPKKSEVITVSEESSSEDEQTPRARRKLDMKSPAKTRHRHSSRESDSVNSKTNDKDTKVRRSSRTKPSKESEVDDSDNPVSDVEMKEEEAVSVSKKDPSKREKKSEVTVDLDAEDDKSDADKSNNEDVDNESKHDTSADIVETSVDMEEGDIEETSVEIAEASSSKLEEEEETDTRENEKTPVKKKSSGKDKEGLLSPNSQNTLAHLELLKEMADVLTKEEDSDASGSSDSDLSPHKKQRKSPKKGPIKKNKEDKVKSEEDSKGKKNSKSKGVEDTSENSDDPTSDNEEMKKPSRRSSGSSEKKPRRSSRKLKKEDSSDDDEESKSSSQSKQKSPQTAKNGTANQRSTRRTRTTKGTEDEEAESADSQLSKEIDKLSELPSRRSRRKAKDTEDSNVDDDGENEDKKTTDTKEKKSKVKTEKIKKKGRKTNDDDDIDDDNSSSDDDDIDEVDDEMEVDEGEEKVVNHLELNEDEIKEEEEGKDKVSAETENKTAKNSLMAELAEAEDESSSDSDSDTDGSSKPKKKKKVGKKKSPKAKKMSDSEEKPADSISDSDSDFEVTKKPRKRTKRGLLDVKLSESDSDFQPSKRKSEKTNGKEAPKGKKRKITSDSEDDVINIGSDDDDDDDKSSIFHDSDVSIDSEEEKRNKRRKYQASKRRRIKEQSDSDIKSGSGSQSGSGSGDDNDKTPGGRKKIRKIFTKKKLLDETKAAAKAEEDRRKRVAERQKKYNVVQEEDDSSPNKCPVTTKLVLECKANTDEPLLEVNKKLVRKLKPHQVEAVQFMWECCCETLSRLRKEPGSGCILAHCMGLGKTLSVVTFVHTMLANYKLTKLSTCLVVCPLNTVLNWEKELKIWLDKKDRLDVFELSRIKDNYARADTLKEWQENGGVLIMGYEMYRNLTLSNKRIKSKKIKKIFEETLVKPGPDLVVCDEGHILKNDNSGLSKAMSQLTSLRRIVLTGTPLQNNLIEYHCMVNFVKPNLLGTRKEFNNRFVNPITNGQCADSTPWDVKVMKRRAHILHDLLAGCVQRRDYTALTKFLPPKYEYVISVRLSKRQIELYRSYLEMKGLIAGDGLTVITKGAKLFSDYQSLIKIWTHPWLLKLDEIRTMNRASAYIDDTDNESDMDSFIDDGSDETDTTESESNHASVSDSEDDKKKKKKRAKYSSSSEESEAEDKKKTKRKGEVVKEWKTRSRGGRGELGESSKAPAEEELPASKPAENISSAWWSSQVQAEDEYNLELSGKLILLMEILRRCEEIGDKVLVFSQSLLSLNFIESCLHHIDEQSQNSAHKEEKEKQENEKAKTDNEKKDDTDSKEKSEENKGDKKDETKTDETKSDETKSDENKTDAKPDKASFDVNADLSELFKLGVSWTCGVDYFRMDGSTPPHLRKNYCDQFNDPDNYRGRLFLISTKAGSLGTNLVAANRVIVFDASWNPSHDIQSIFRVYRFGQTKPAYIYRLLAQGTMEEKIYERQVTKQSLSQRVVDEHQIERHFNLRDLQELYRFQPDVLDDPNRPERPTPVLPKDHMLADLLQTKKQWVVTYHEHDSLLENQISEELTEEERKAAWEDFEQEKKGITNRGPQVYANSQQQQNYLNMLAGMQQQQQRNNQHMNPGAFGSMDVRPPNVLAIIHEVRRRFPNLTPEALQMQVQSVVREQIAQQILQQQEFQRRQIEQRQIQEQERLRQIQAQIQQRQQNLETHRSGILPNNGVTGAAPQAQQLPKSK